MRLRALHLDTLFQLWHNFPNQWLPFLIPLAAMNLLAFALMGIDKKRSKEPGAHRISEKTLFLAALLGGGMGAYLGMRLFRHKTKHWYFAVGIPVIWGAQVLLAAFLILQ